MTPYLDLSGTSGVRAYEIGPGYIKVWFHGQRGAGPYVYDHRHPGRTQVETMQALARAGRGLSTYISQVVGTAYARAPG
jgi:hypothetical protein